MVNKLAPVKKVLKEAIDFAGMLAENNDTAIYTMKRCINYAMDNDTKKGIEYEVGLFAEMMRRKLVENAQTV